MPVQLHTRVHNPVGDHSALLLHGLGSDGATMWRLASHLADRGYRVVCPDLRGHGLSPAAASYRVGDYANDVALLGAGWDLVVGHSLGGATAATLLARTGWTTRALLIDPVLRLSPEQRSQIAPGQTAGPEGMSADEVRADNPRWDDEDVFRQVRASTYVSRTVVHRSLYDTDPWDLLHLPAEWDAQVTILQADPEHGALFSRADADAVTAVGDVRVVTAPGCGHSIHRDDPQMVLDLL